MSPKKMSISKQQDKSDVLSLLKSIESMYEVCQNVLNTYTQATLMLSIAIEAQMLLMKLRVMRERWMSHLPFKEACTVDFYDWGKKVDKMSRSLVTDEKDGDDETLSEYCPSKHFVLDFYEMLSSKDAMEEIAPYYRETAIPKFIAHQDKIRKEVSKHWSTYKYRISDLVAQELNPRLGGILTQMADKSVSVRMVCSDVLQQLSIALYQLHEMPQGIIQRDQFSRLAERVINEQEYGGRKALTSARRDVDNLKNTTPENQWAERCEGEIKASMEIIGEMKFGRRVFEFIGTNNDVKGHFAGLGRFLNSVRREISEGELSYLLEQLYRILYFHEDIEQQATEEKQQMMEKQAAETGGKTSAKDAMTIYQRRKNMQPECPKLPVYFNSEFAMNHAAVKKYYEILHHCGFYIGRPLIDTEKRDKTASAYDGWKWKHLRETFMRLGLITKDHPKKAFAEYLEKVFPYLEAANVQRGFNSRGTYDDPNAFARIVNEIMDEFRPVCLIFKH